MSINRRQFLRTAAGAVSGAALAGSSLKAQQSTLSDPASCGADHIVVVMMENRSFDHLLGWGPGRSRQQPALSYVGAHGESLPTQRLSSFVGCSHPDPD